MKNILILVWLILALSACQKEESIPLQNQMSFKMDGELIICTGPFAYSAYTFSGHFKSSKIKDGILQIETSHFHQEGDYLFEYMDGDDQISVWSGGACLYETYRGFLNQCQGSGRISIDEVGYLDSKGRFECIFPCESYYPISITEGEFQASK